MIPFVDLLKQPDDITCGPTSVAMVLRYYGKKSDIESIKKITKTVWYSVSGRDFGMTSPQLISVALKKNNLNAVVRQGSIKKLKFLLADDVPVIVLVRSGEWNWHYIVVIGYDKDMIFYANPSNSEVEGLSVQEFSSAWSWNSDLRGNSCKWWISFWLRSLEIYPNTYIAVKPMNN